MSELTLKYVEDIEGVKRNIIQFNDDVKRGLFDEKRMRDFFVWYYIEEIDMLAPSKYIKYLDMNFDKYMHFDEERYCTATNHEFHGSSSYVDRKKWFEVVTDKAEHKELESKVKDLLYAGGYEFALKPNISFKSRKGV